jgi:hypothetical protein
MDSRIKTELLLAWAGFLASSAFILAIALSSVR